MDPADGFIMLVITVIMSISFVFGVICSTFMQRNDDDNDKKKKPPIEGMFQIKGNDHAQVHLYEDCHRVKGAEMTRLEHCNVCNSVIRKSEFCSSCKTRRGNLKKTQ